MCTLTAAGRGDIYPFHSLGISEKLQNQDFYMNQVSEGGLVKRTLVNVYWFVLYICSIILTSI